jgi:hypothetical protein
MILPFYYIEDTWCILEVSIKKNNIYWIDWDVVYDKDGVEVIDSNLIDLQYLSKDKNILCIDNNNNYSYYNTTEYKIYTFQPNYNIYPMNSFVIMSYLNKTYPEFLYEINIDITHV